jgi:hypothetical protein
MREEFKAEAVAGHGNDAPDPARSDMFDPVCSVEYDDQQQYET